MTGSIDVTEYGKSLQANATAIPGLTVWDLPVHGNNRGWFKEDWRLVTRDVDTIDQELRLLACLLYTSPSPRDRS